MKIKNWSKKDTLKAIFGLVLVIIVGVVSASISYHNSLYEQTPGVYKKLNEGKLADGKYAMLFFRKDCKFCQKAMPIVQQEYKRKAQNVIFYKIDTASKTGKEIATDYSINTTPTLINFEIKSGVMSPIQFHSITYMNQKKNKNNQIIVKRNVIHEVLQGKEVINE